MANDTSGKITHEDESDKTPVPVVRLILNNAVSIILSILFFVIVSVLYIWFMQFAIELHPIWPALIAIGYFILALIGIRDLRSLAALSYLLRKVILIYALIVLIATLSFGTISSILFSLNWAEYIGAAPIEFYDFYVYYLWLFLEMVPALKINATLSFAAPLESVGFAAGLPILAFQIFVIFVLLKALAPWWQGRKNKPAPATALP